MSVIFIAGCGTDIGKTYVTALITRQLRAASRPVVALKPVASGVPPLGDPAFAESDTAKLLAAQNLATTEVNVAACSPWRFRAPLSPDMAAAAEGRSLCLRELVDWCRAKIDALPAATAVLIEGVGGLMSPAATDATNLDWIKALRCRTLLVAGTYLGAISHALTACETGKAHGISWIAVVLNESANSTVPFDATLGTLRRFSPGETIVPLRRNADRIELDLA